MTQRIQQLVTHIVVLVPFLQALPGLEPLNVAVLETNLQFAFHHVADRGHGVLVPAGFTAWSSVRDPSQVFQLLEAVYGAFDKIAKR